MPEIKRLYEKIRKEARKRMIMKRPTTAVEQRPEKECTLQPKPTLQGQQRQRQQDQKPRPKNLDEFALALARNLLEAGVPREAVFIRLYNYLKKKHPEKADTVYVSNLAKKAWLSMMEERRKKEQRDYPEPDEFLGPEL